jgi:predicted PurR-regulated permease PerM
MSDEPPTPTRRDRDWSSLHLWQIQPIRDVLTVLAAIVLVYLGYLLSPVTVPMLLALLLAYLVEPVVRLMRARMPWVTRPIAAGVIIVGMALLVVVPVGVGLTVGVVQATGFVNELTDNLSDLRASVDDPDDWQKRQELPQQWWPVRDYLVGLTLDDDVVPDAGDVDAPGEESQQGGDGQEAVEGSAATGVLPPAPPPEELTATQRLLQQALRATTTYIEDNLKTITENLPRALETGAALLGSIAGAFGSLFLLSFGLFLTLFFFFFFCSGLGAVKRFLEELIPSGHRPEALQLAHQMDAVIAAFVRGRLTIMVILSIEFVIAYWLIGVPAPLLVGLLVGVLSIVPYLSLIGIPISIGLMWIGDTSGASWHQEWWWVLGAPTVVYFIVQATDDYVWTPLIQGKATGMDTPTILFAVLAGGILAGFYGVLIAIPTAACLKILVREVVWPKFKAWIEGHARDPLPIKRESSE